jgi:hypothetical protein
MASALQLGKDIGQVVDGSDTARVPTISITPPTSLFFFTLSSPVSPLSRTRTQHGVAMATPRTMRAVQYDKYGGGAEGLKVHVLG